MIAFSNVEGSLSVFSVGVLLIRECRDLWDWIYAIRECTECYNQLTLILIEAFELMIWKSCFVLWLQGDPLYVKVNKLSSTKTQLPYDFYYLNYCKPPKILNTGENLGEVLRGDRIENSVYTVSTKLIWFIFFPSYLWIWCWDFGLCFSLKCWRISPVE